MNILKILIIIKLDQATGKPFREAEAEAAAAFENVTDGVLRAAKKGEAGDFVATSGKFANKSIDHLGVPKEALGTFKMGEFTASITKSIRYSRLRMVVSLLARRCLNKE